MQLNDVLQKQGQLLDNHSELIDDEIILLRFSLDENYFALPIDKAREVIQGGDIARTPEVHPFVLGVLNLRGNLIPILKPESFMEFSGQKNWLGKGDMTTLVLEEDGLTFGILVEKVKKIITRDEGQFKDVKNNYVMNILDMPCLFLDLQTIIKKVR